MILEDSCVSKQNPPPSLDIYKHNGDDEPQDIHYYFFLKFIMKKSWCLLGAGKYGN
jgi:hypothetical protein